MLGSRNSSSSTKTQHCPSISSLLKPLMEDYYYRKGYRNVQAFGNWDWNSDLPFTQCFETARQAAGLVGYSYSEDSDLYVVGELYENDVVTPATIVVTRRGEKARKRHVKDGRKQERWVASNMKEPPSPTSPIMGRQTPKPVDEDLYKVPPELVYSKPEKKRGTGFFSTCLQPICFT